MPTEHRTRREEHGEWLVPLPRGARPPLRVWINGVEQREGQDYAVSQRGLHFDRPLEKEGRLGFWRWASIFFGIAGTYRKNDSVDVQYEVDGETRLATGLEIKRAPLGDSRAARGVRNEQRS